jgi:anti-anti-sigma factor
MSDVSTYVSATSLIAPTRLVADTRLEFRKDAVRFLEETAADGSRTATIDFGHTGEMDATGLGTLVGLQRRAEQLGLHVRLENLSERVHFLLVLTKLDHLFVLA